MSARSLLLLAAFGALTLSACDTLECSEGTHRVGDLCVPNVLIECAEGTSFEDGKCVADAHPDGGLDAGSSVTCGQGTRLEGTTCVADIPDAGPDPDMILPDMAPDPDDGVPPDVGPDAAPEPDAAPPVEACPDELVPTQEPPMCPAAPGTYCVRGVALDFLTGCALPQDAGLGLLLIDPAAAAGGAPIEEYTRGVGAIGPGGGFAIAGAGDSTQLALVIDEAPEAPGNHYTRSVSGVTAAQPAVGQTFAVTAFASTQAQTAIWTEELGLPEGGLEATGFLIGRVLSIGAEGATPLAGAEVSTRLNDLIACEESCLRFFDDDPRLTGFQDQGATTTGASGAFMVIRGGGSVLQDSFYVKDHAEYADIPAGASPGSGFHTAFVPQR